MTTDNSAVIARLQQQRDELAEALRECSTALREEVESRRGHKLDRRIDRDLSVAVDADRVLANLDSEPAEKLAEQPTIPKQMGERDAFSESYKMGWNACRACMLGANTQQPAEQPAVPEIHPAVMAFARAMQYKLDANKHKDGKGWERDANGARNGWSGASIKFLLYKLEEETDELTEVVEEHGGDAIWQEAADVGNIAMMLADNTGALQYAPQPPASSAPSHHSREGVSDDT